MSNILPDGNETIGSAAEPFAAVHASSFKKGGNELATLASPSFTSNPTAPTQAEANDSTRLANTSFVTRAIATLKTFALSRTNHTGTQPLNTISNAGSLAAKSAVATADIEDGAVTGAKLSNTGVTAGAYTNVSITVDAQGRITLIANGNSSDSYTDANAVAAIVAALVNTDSIAFTESEGALTADLQIKTALTGGAQGSLGSGVGGVYVVLGSTSTTAAAGNDGRFPSAAEKAALAGVVGQEPSDTNRFVSDNDPRLSFYEDGNLIATLDNVNDRIQVYDESLDEVGYVTPATLANGGLVTLDFEIPLGQKELVVPYGETIVGAKPRVIGHVFAASADTDTGCIVKPGVYSNTGCTVTAGSDSHTGPIHGTLLIAT